MAPILSSQERASSTLCTWDEGTDYSYSVLKTVDAEAFNNTGINCVCHRVFVHCVNVVYVLFAASF